MSVGDEKIEQAVIVVIEKTGAPAQERNGRAAEAGFEGNIGEARVAVVAIKSFVIVRECSDEEIQAAVAIVVA